MTRIPARLRRQVFRRSGGRCEYCHLSQDGQEATFHIDHITPVTSGGQTIADNLALACVSCSLRKGPRQSSADPNSGVEVLLYHPRREVWSDHFEWRHVQLFGLTATGRATIKALELNRPLILAIREEEAALGRHP
jgi:hypothetical protein